MVASAPSNAPDAHWLSQSSSKTPVTGDNWDELVTAEVASQNEADNSSEIIMMSPITSGGAHDQNKPQSLMQLFEKELDDKKK